MNHSDYTQPTHNIFFPNQKEPIYDPSDPAHMFAFKMYWQAEKDRCIHGFKIAGGKVKIPGRLYFHCVYGKIARYIEKTIGGEERKIKEITQPLLRDIDWDIFNDLEECDNQGKFYALVGSRDFGKSIIAASCASHQYTFYDKSESLISSGDSKYIKLTWDKVEDFLLNIHPVFKKQRLKSDWKSEILAGWKDKSTNLPDTKSSFSNIKPINYEMGNKSMAANGTRPGFHLFDEIGTMPNLIGCVKDSDGCWWSGGGDKPSCLVMLAGTGGDMEKGKEAAEIFYAPKSYNILSFPDTWEGNGDIGRFIPATRAKLKYKVPKTLSEYLGISHPDLDKITILVSDEELALKDWWEPEYQKALKSGNSKTVLKFKAYWPIKPSDSFIVLTKNDYNIEEAKKQQNNLKKLRSTGTPVTLDYNYQGMVIHEFTDKLPITEFPVKTQAKDAPVVIYEFPMENPPFGLYTAGVDPYRQSESEYSDSLGAIYIFKRIHNITGEGYQNMFVASYVARPNDIKKWNETARKLIKFYNARTLCENDEMSFINYMIDQGDGHYLEDQPEWLKTIVPGTRVNRSKGIHRSSKQIRDFLDGELKNYLDDTIYEERDENGSITKQVFGVTKVLDPMLLEEIIKFDKDKNFDRVIAAQLAIALANKLNPIIKVSSLNQDNRTKSYFEKYSNRNRSTNKKVLTFSGNFTITRRKNKLFL